MVGGAQGARAEETRGQKQKCGQGMGERFHFHIASVIAREECPRREDNAIVRRLWADSQPDSVSALRLPRPQSRDEVDRSGDCNCGGSAARKQLQGRPTSGRSAAPFVGQGENAKYWQNHNLMS